MMLESRQKKLETDRLKGNETNKKQVELFSLLYPDINPNLNKIS